MRYILIGQGDSLVCKVFGMQALETEFRSLLPKEQSGIKAYKSAIFPSVDPIYAGLENLLSDRYT